VASEIQVIIDIILAAGPAFATYYLAALGHGIFEKSGVLNLAIDGVFTLGVAIAFAVTAVSGNPNLGLIAAIASASAFGLLIAYLTIKLPISHGAIGLSIMFVGYGLASLVGVPVRRVNPSANWYPIDNLFWLSLIIGSIAIGILIHNMLSRTKLGAAIRATGENPHAASSLGISVMKIRLISGMLGYALIGAGSALFVLAYTQSWTEGTGMGHGWIAFAISLSAGRDPMVTMLASTVFAALLKYQYNIQAALKISPHITNMIPFVAALAAMVVFMVTPLHRKLAPPKSLGKRYFKEERTV